MTVIYIIVLVGAVTAGLAKFWRTRELSSKLGREVEDHELVSLNSWLEAEEKTEEKRRAHKGKPVRYDSASFEKQAVNKNTFKEKFASQTDEIPDNCPNCGAVFSKGIPYCGFCGSHASRNALEEHCAVFLLDTEKDFEKLIPASHVNWRIGCFVIPIVMFPGLFIFGRFFVNSQDAACAVLIGGMVVSIVIAFVWNHFVDKRLTEKESELFDRAIAPKIRQFVKRNRLNPLEFLSIAKCHLDEKSDLLKRIHRLF